MVRAACCILRHLDGFRREVKRETLHFLGLLQALSNIFAFTIHRGINFMGHLAVALVFLKADVVRARADPNWLAIPGERRLPYTKMMAAGHHRDWFCLFISEILITPE